MKAQFEPMSREELLALPASVDLPTAARALGIGKALAYELAGAGQFPVRVLKLGNVSRVPSAELMAYLGVTPGDRAVAVTERVKDAVNRLPTSKRVFGE